MSADLYRSDGRSRDRSDRAARRLTPTVTPTSLDTGASQGSGEPARLRPETVPDTLSGFASRRSWATYGPHGASTNGPERPATVKRPAGAQVGVPAVQR